MDLSGQRESRVPHEQEVLFRNVFDLFLKRVSLNSCLKYQYRDHRNHGEANEQQILKPNFSKHENIRLRSGAAYYIGLEGALFILGKCPNGLRNITILVGVRSRRER